MVILEHPEDLGKAGTDVPGSIWQLESIKELASQSHVVTGAIRQSDFGTAYQKPTRLLGRLPGLSDHVFQGWPTFDNDGHYTGPLPKFSGTSTRLIGRQGAAFRTTDTAAWPESLCHLLAQLAVAAVRNSAHAEALSKGDGGGDCGVKVIGLVEGFPRDLAKSDSGKAAHAMNSTWAAAAGGYPFRNGETHSR